MGLFDLVFDELSKEIREAPGWLSLVFVCNLLLFVPAIREELEHLELSKEETTIATLVAMALFFLGDVLDSFVFPREKDGKRGQRLLKGSMLLLGAVAVFLFLVRAWLWAAGVTLVWILIIPIYDTRERPLWSVFKGWIEAAIPQKKAAVPKESDDEWTGFKRLVLQYDDLTKSTNGVRGKLGIRPRIYEVSKTLARQAERYTVSIWLPNEAAKFIRSVFFPTLIAACVWPLVDQRRWPAALLILASLAILLFYCWLKGLHMRKLYDLAIEIVETNPAYSSPEPCHGVRLFLWRGEVVACVSVPPLAK